MALKFLIRKLLYQGQLFLSISFAILILISSPVFGDIVDGLYFEHTNSYETSKIIDYLNENVK